MNKPLFEGYEWDNKLLLDMWEVINDIAINKFGLEYYPDPTIELVSYEQMLYYCNQGGLPLTYDHWSFGKNYIASKKLYERGQHGLAYEVIINSNPLRAYLMDTNTATMQALVLAHSVCGHGSFFTTNYMFKQWTMADYILDYMKYAHDYINSAYEKYGTDEVDKLLTRCHLWQYYGVDKYKRKSKIKQDVLIQKYNDYKFNIESTKADLWTPEPIKSFDDFAENYERGLPEENVLYYVEKHSSVLKPWQREIVRIVRKIAQYFYPQMHTKLMNEGFASFVHYELMTEMHNQGYLTDGSYVEFLHNHTNVCCSHAYSETNPYSLGIEMFQDIFKKNGRDWSVIKDVVANYRDESFITQFLSKEVITKLKLAMVTDSAAEKYQTITGTHSDDDYTELKEALAYHWSPAKHFADLYIADDIEDTEDGKRLVVVHYNRGENNDAFESQGLQHAQYALEQLLGARVTMIAIMD